MPHKTKIFEIGWFWAINKLILFYLKGKINDHKKSKQFLFKKLNQTYGPNLDGSSDKRYNHSI